jgi:hypothetical protein
MYRQRNVATQLLARIDRLDRANSNSYHSELRHLFEFIRRNGYLRGLVKQKNAEFRDYTWAQ